MQPIGSTSQDGAMFVVCKRRSGCDLDVNGEIDEQRWQGADAGITKRMRGVIC